MWREDIITVMKKSGHQQSVQGRAEAVDEANSEGNNDFFFFKAITK